MHFQIKFDAVNPASFVLILQMVHLSFILFGLCVKLNIATGFEKWHRMCTCGRHGVAAAVICGRAHQMYNDNKEGSRIQLRLVRYYLNVNAPVHKACSRPKS